MLRRAPNPTAGLTVGILEPGRENSGIRRYSEIVSGGLEALGDRTAELALTPVGRGRRGLSQALQVVSRMRQADAALIPYTRSNVWSPGPVRLLQLVVVHLGLRRRTVSVLHDVYPPGGPNRLEWWVLSAVLLLSGRVVLHTDHERRNLALVPGGRRAQVIPHFVLARDRLPDRAAARTSFGVPPATTVLAMIGWMNPRKNYELAIDTLAELPADVVLWLVGGAGLGLDWYLEELRERIRGQGVEDRVVITGAVSEDELERRLASVDIGLCPYRRISASGSVSTLLGARRPVLVTDVDFARELKLLAPEAVHTLERLEPGCLARAILHIMDAPPAPEAFEDLLTARSLNATAKRYRERLAAVSAAA
jgi:glycosyltransferase involved in cell wall biosynthesis